MTPEQLDHLQKIKTHLETLLETAKKRTPGRWQQGDSAQEMNMDMVYRQPDIIGSAAGIPAYGRNSGLSREQDQHDAAFIASCAGNAEAGWRSTKETIKWALFMHENGQVGEGLLDSILAAWPLELITKHQ